MLARPSLRAACKASAGGVLVERGQHLAVGADAFGNLGDGGVRRRNAIEFAREEVGAVLIADRQRVAEAVRNREQGRLALAFEERVGGHRRAHADRERRERACARTGQVADRTHRRVAGAGGVFAQIFGRDDGAVGAARDDIGEGAAAVDPDLPTRAGFRPRRQPATSRSGQRMMMVRQWSVALRSQLPFN